MSHIGDIFMRLRLDSKGFNKELKGVQGMAAKAGKTLAAAFTVRAITNFSKQCLELGSDLQEVQNVVDVTFGKMSDKVNKFALEAAANHGLSETMAKKYTGTFGAMAKAFGFSEQAAYDMSTTLTGLAGDVASFYNLSQDEAYTKLKSVFTGETESLNDLGVVMTQTALDQYALANGFGKTTAAMTEQEKVALRYKFITEQLAAADGDFARTRNSWANQTRILSLQVESFKAAIGQGFINVLTPVIQWLNVLIGKLVVAANAFKNFTETLFGNRNTGPSQTKTATEDLDAVTSSADSATAATNKTTAAAKKLKRELAGFDQITKLGSEEESAGSDAGTTSGGTSTSASTPSVDDGTAEKVSKLSEKYSKLAESIGNLKEKFKTFTDLLRDAGKWVYDNVLEPLGKWTMNELLPAFLDYLSGAFALLTSACKLLQPVWQWLWDNLFSKLASFVGDAIILVLKEFAWRLNALAEVFDTVGEKIGAIPEKIAGIKESVKQKWDEVKANITGKTAEFKAKVATKWDELKDKWKKLTSNIQNKTASFAGKVTSTVKSIRDAWKKVAAEWKNKTAQFGLKFSAAASDLKTWVNTNVIDKINTKFKKVPVLKNHLIPHLAQGGYVKKNTPQLAMIGDNRHFGEIVAPENKLQEMARMAAAGAGGSSPEVIALLREIVELLKTLNLDVTIEGNSLMQIIVRLINQQTKSTGKCPVMV